MSRKQRFNEVVEKYIEEITTLSKLDLNSNHSKEKVKIFVWTKIKTEINYSPATYYLDIFLNIKKAHSRKL